MRQTLGLLLLILLALASPVAAVPGQPFAEETLTVSTTTVGITANLCRVAGAGSPEGQALIQVKGNGIWYGFAGEAVVDSGDYVGNVGDVIEVQVPSRFRAIRSGAADATLKVTCFQ